MQSPHEVIKKVNIEPELIKDQLTTIKEFYDIEVINIGVLGEIRNLGFIVSEFPEKKIIFDPIFFSGSGKFVFLNKKEINHLKDHFKYLYLITPNIPEAEILSGEKIKTVEDIKKSAQIIKNNLEAKNILIKGGHLKGKRCFDILLRKNRFHTYGSPKTDFRIHGTGSFLNAGISTYLFKGESLITSIKKSKTLLKNAIKQIDKNHPILNI